MMLDYERIRDFFTPLINGRTVLIHSAYKRFAPVNGGPSTVVNAIVDAAGRNGTVIFPTFNFDHCDGIPYDKYHTKSKMGAISEVARLHSWSYKYNHPIYSCAYFASSPIDDLEHAPATCYGKDSIFDYVKRANGLIVVMGLQYNDSMTFFHHVEECAKVPYRHYKSFPGAEMYVRGNNVITNVEPMGQILEAAGLVQTDMLEDRCIKSMNASDVFDATYKLIKTGAAFHNNPGLLYSLEEYNE